MAITELQCFLSLALSGLNFTDFAHYDTFFMNSSVITLSQAGSFQGPIDISEYVSFASSASAYFADSSSLPDNVRLHTIDQKAGTCIFDILRSSLYTFSKPAFAGASAWVAYGLRMTLAQQSAAFRTAYVYYPVPTMRIFFESFFMTSAMRTFVCSTMKDHCPVEWAASHWHASTPLDACEAELSKLPIVEGDLSYFNRNTSGCRILHAEFARKDISHCPHLSFPPMRDAHGHLVCQPQQPRTTPQALGFDAEFIERFHAFAASRGIDAATGSNLADIPCSTAQACPSRFACEPNAPRARMLHYWVQQATYAARHPLNALRFGGHPTLFRPSSSPSVCVAKPSRK